MPSFLTKAVGRPIARFFKKPQALVTGLRKGLNTIRDVAGIVAPVAGPLAPALMEASVASGLAGKVAGNVASKLKRPTIEKALPSGDKFM